MVAGGMVDKALGLLNNGRMVVKDREDPVDGAEVEPEHGAGVGGGAGALHDVGEEMH